MKDQCGRTIIHIDMDAFFAAVEVLSNPGLAGKPLIICGNPDERSVVSTASYEARRYGVASGMPITRARRLCPQGIYLSGDPDKYVHVSLRILNLLKEFTDRVEPFSIDEAFLDLSANLLEGRCTSTGIALKIKQAIRSRLGLTCSAGIAPNKLVAKMASSLHKPDGLSCVPEGKFLEVFGSETVSRLWGVGEKTEVLLGGIGIRTIGDLASCPEPVLVRAFGVEGERLYHASRGIDDTPVIPYYEGLDAKSVGHEHTLAEDVDDADRLESVILRLSDQVTRRMRSHHYQGRTVTLKIRNAKFRTCTRQRVLGIYTDEERTIFGVARDLFRMNWRGERVRLLGVSVSNLIRTGDRPQSLLFEEDRRHRELLKTLDSVKDIFGENALTRARLVGSR